MSLTAGTVASSLDELTHVHPLVVGPSNVDKPHLSLFFSLLPFFCFFFWLYFYVVGGSVVHLGFIQQWCVCVNVCVWPCQLSTSTLSLL